MRDLDIRARVLLAALVPATAIAVLLTVFFMEARFGDLDTALREQCLAQARQIAAASEYGVFSGNRQAVQSLADSTLMSANVRGVLILGHDGKLLAYGSRGGDILHLQTLARDTAREYSGQQGGLVLSIVPVGAEEMPLGLDTKSATDDARPLGRILLAMDDASLQQKKLHLLATGVGISLLLLGFATLLALRMAKAVTRPMEEMEHALERINRGDYGVKVHITVGGTLARLADALNRMAAQLAVSQDEMQQRVHQATEELVLRKEEAERANAAKSRFLAAASHDLRQPMHALGLFVGQLQQRDSSPESRHLIARIAESVKALGGLLDGLLDISKLDAGVLTPEVSDFPAIQILSRLQNDFTQAALAKGLYLHVRPSPLWLRTDPVLFERILLNLVSNAIRYTEKGGILLACRKRGNTVRIEVRDSGIGIPADAHDTIFQEFVQLGNPGRNRSQGLGLGLAIVRRLTRLLGLTLELRSKPGGGSLFAIEVPQAEPVVAAPEFPPRQLPGVVLEDKVIAVVDDDELVLDSITGLLESWGCIVLPGTSGPQAAARIRSMGLVPDALLCDYRLLEGEKGTQVVQAIRQEFGQKIPAILISGDTDPEILALARDAGLALLHKPVSSPKLRTLLHRILGKR